MENQPIGLTWRLIGMAADLARTYALSIVESGVENLTVSQQNVLGAVYCHSRPGIMVKEIATELGLTPGAVSQTVESLVRLGVVERVHSEQDRRAVLIMPSAKGIEMRKRVMDRIDPILADVLSNFKTEDAETFQAILKMLVSRLTELNAIQKKAKSVRMHSHAMEGVE